MKLDISEVIERFPDYRVAFVAASGLAIVSERPDALEAEIETAEAVARGMFDLEGVGRIPGVRAWRDAYKGFGIKKTSYRSSVERLLRGVLQGRGLPRINAFVDAYNRVSLAHLFPLGADDVDRIAPPLTFRYARDGDSFLPLGQDDEDPPKSGEVVFADSRNVLCRRWNWYQDGRSVIRPDTVRAIVTIQSGGAGDLAAAIVDLEETMAAHCGARTRAAVLDADSPTGTLEPD